MTGPSPLRVALLSREYPPAVYGGAGVHVEYLARELARRVDLTVHAWGSPDGAAARSQGHEAWSVLAGAAPHLAALRAVSIDLSMAAAVDGVDLVHSHTWYANLGGHLAKLLYGIPHVATVHSLEPLRPWKVEQLGGGYALSSWCERSALEAADAVVAVSAENRRDILQVYPSVDPGRVGVIYNGIDANEYTPDSGTDVLERYGVDPDRPIVLFVGRITRQKGVGHLARAARSIDPSAQVVLCAGAPDSPEIEAEVSALVEAAAAVRPVRWIPGMLSVREKIQLLSHATVFVCPSIYEPLGIVNLEAMACATAVVATRTGGIPEVVVDGETGLLVPLEIGDPSTREPADPEAFAAALADAVNQLLAETARSEAFGRAGRQRALSSFSWSSIADQVIDLYRGLVNSG
ncbi:MAG TPA: glycogen synthase [Frankiaceae bacterium]|nr:glycogen synthase [Frankiaceae bacterium]